MAKREKTVGKSSPVQGADDTIPDRKPDSVDASAWWTRLNGQLEDCQKCPRLSNYIAEVARNKRKSYRDWDYWGKPVPNFGDPKAKILLVGLAPAAHGANRTGRMFTGDRSGDFLFKALHDVGLCNQAEATDSADGLSLIDCAITAICHCAPPQNRPTGEEIRQCGAWMDQLLEYRPFPVYLALGQLAWSEMLKHAQRRDWFAGPRNRAAFGHGASVDFENGSTLLGSYHPSQQNTFTGKLTQSMLVRVLRRARKLAGL